MQPTAKLTIDQALHNIKLVIESFKGTLQEHIALQESFKLVTEYAKSPALNIDEKDIVKEPLNPQS